MMIIVDQFNYTDTGFGMYFMQTSIIIMSHVILDLQIKFANYVVNVFYFAGQNSCNIDICTITEPTITTMS